MKKNDVIRLAIESISSDGSGVAHHDGFPVFVPFTAAGDVIDAKIVKVKKNLAFGIINSLITSSPDRIDVDCPAFGRCGGCSFRHISYEAELRAKEAIFYSALERLGGLKVEHHPILHSDAVDHYRNKGEFPAGKDMDVCLYSKRSHRTIPIPGDCLIQDSTVTALALDCASVLRDIGVSPYDEITGSGVLRHIHIRSNASGEAYVCLVINAESLPGPEEFISSVTASHPEVRGICININRDNTNVILGDRYIRLWGDEYLNDELAGVPVHVYPASFLQINRKCAEILYSKVRELAALSPSESVLDLYCGMGTIGLSVCGPDNRLTGIEVVPEAVAAAREAALVMGYANTEFICGDAGSVISDLRSRGVAFDTVITDPPRKGCSKETLATIVSLAPEKVIMVSCNPATMARDLRILEDSGYTLRCAVPADMFPRTVHVEGIALLTKLTQE